MKSEPVDLKILEINDQRLESILGELRRLYSREGIQRCRIYRDVLDRQDFLSRLWANVDGLALMLC